MHYFIIDWLYRQFRRPSRTSIQIEFVNHPHYKYNSHIWYFNQRQNKFKSTICELNRSKHLSSWTEANVLLAYLLSLLSIGNPNWIDSHFPLVKWNYHPKIEPLGWSYFGFFSSLPSVGRDNIRRNFIFTQRIFANFISADSNTLFRSVVFIRWRHSIQSTITNPKVSTLRIKEPNNW